MSPDSLIKKNPSSEIKRGDSEHRRFVLVFSFGGDCDLPFPPRALGLKKIRALEMAVKGPTIPTVFKKFPKLLASL